MDRGIFATHWVDWRELRGRSPRHRHQMDDILTSFPTLLYFGDSWFSTPLYPNLARQSIEAINGMAMIDGKPGATSGDLLDRTEKIERLADYIEGYRFDALLVSLGGNDAIDKLEAVFHAGDAPLTPEAALDRVISTRVFEHVFNRYDRLLRRLEQSSRLPDHFRLIVHGYAPLVRIGVPADLNAGNLGVIGMVVSSTGPWLWGPMRHVLPDKEAGARFSELLLVNGFRDTVLQPLKARYPELVETVDFTALPEMQSEDSWFDEIHPNKKGFAHMAAHLNRAIKSRLPSAKQPAVPG